MKKILQIFAPTLAIFTLMLSPVVANAQGVIEVGGGTPTPQSPAAVESEPTKDVPSIPDTGIAPNGRSLTENAAIFIGGSVLGAVIGLGVVGLRKRQAQH